MGDPLIQAKVNEYVKHDGVRCPYCGSENIEAVDISTDAGSAYDEKVCICGRSWTDVYHLVGIVHDDEKDRYTTYADNIHTVTDFTVIQSYPKAQEAPNDARTHPPGK